MVLKSLINILETNPELKQDLFIRGFLITDNKKLSRQAFPFYGSWKEISRGKFVFLTHPLTGLHFYTAEDGKIFFLLGHAYNPFEMEIQEEKILQKLAHGLQQDAYLSCVNELTGIFLLGYIDGEKIHFLVDPAGIQSACCGRIGEHFYCSSHAQLVGDLLNLQMTDFVKELVAYKWYRRVMGPYLPGDLTPFAELKRIIPSISYEYEQQVKHWRYWPLESHAMAEKQEDYQQVVQEAADILKKNGSWTIC